MILVIGAAASGKRAYVKSCGYAEADMADAVLNEKPVLYNLQGMLRLEPSFAPDLLTALLEKEVVICDEVGSGVIPSDPLERAAREQCGRLCILLAQRAERVVRLVCGIPTVLKG